MVIKEFIQFLLQLKVLNYVTAVPLIGIGVQFRAADTSALPLFTVQTVIMRTMAGEGPAVVQRPDHRYLHLCQRLKHRFHIQVIAVQIMEVDQIRIKLLQILHRLLRIPGIRKSVTVKQERIRSLQRIIKETRKPARRSRTCIGSATIVNLSFDARHLRKLFHKTARASKPCH